jgi:hypothetical protein
MNGLRASLGQVGAIVYRVGTSLAVVVAIATLATSQAPEDMVENGAEQPQRLPIATVSGLPTAAEFPKVAASGDMIGFSHDNDLGTQTITLVHTKKSWMAVYHIDKSGNLRLVSSRPIDADFSLQLNATSPLPEEIRQMGRR